MSKKQILQLARFAVALFLIQRVSPLVLGQFAAIAVTWAEFPPDIKGGLRLVKYQRVGGSQRTLLYLHPLSAS